MDPSILIAPIVVCVAAGLLCYLLNRRLRVLSGLIALAAAVVSLLQSVRIYLAEPTEYLYKGYQLNLGGLTLEASLRSSPLSGLLLLGVAFFGVIIVLYSLHKMRLTEEPGKYYGFALWALRARPFASGATTARQRHWPIRRPVGERDPTSRLRPAIAAATRFV